MIVQETRNNPTNYRAYLIERKDIKIAKII